MLQQRLFVHTFISICFDGFHSVGPERVRTNAVWAEMSTDKDRRHVAGGRSYFVCGHTLNHVHQWETAIIHVKNTTLTC